MPKLPILSGKKIIKALEKAGYVVVRQRSSHIRLSCEGRKSVTIPDYRSIDRSLLIKILRDANLSTNEFVKLV